MLSHRSLRILTFSLTLADPCARPAKPPTANPFSFGKVNTRSHLTGGRLLARNTLLNIGGEAAPFIVAFVAIPILIRGVGAEGYGVLTVVMLAVGYFGIFSLGLGPAATKYLSEAVASGNDADIPGLFWTSFYLMFGFGVLGAVLVASLSPCLVTRILKIAPALQEESLHAFYLLALSLPFVISGATFSGALSAFQRFDLINAFRVPAGVLYYGAPLAVLPFSQSLSWIVAAIVIVRVASWTCSLALCLYILPEVRREMAPRRTMVRPLLGFGGWISVSGIFVPVLEYADRLIIGSMLSVAAVAYYAVPYQVTNKLRLVPGAISSVIFPALSGSFSADPGRTTVLFERATRYTLLALFPPVLIIVTLAPEALTLWVGQSFASHSAAAMRWLTFAVFVNGIAYTPYSLIRAADRPDLLAKMHATAALAYLLMLVWWMLPAYGIAGAAAAYAIRTTGEMIVCFGMARRLMPDLAPGVAWVAKVVAEVLVALMIGLVPMTIAAKGAFLASMLGLYTLACWTVLLEPAEKAFVHSYLATARTLVAGAHE